MNAGRPRRFSGFGFQVSGFRFRISGFQDSAFREQGLLTDKSQQLGNRPCTGRAEAMRFLYWANLVKNGQECSPCGEYGR
jgi:hypothetical protein